MCQCVIFTHHPLQLREFADHLGEQIGLGEPRRAPCLFHVGTNLGRKLRREPLDALDALPLRAELLVKDDVLELRQPILEPRLEIGVVEEFGVREPRADHALVAGNDRLAAVLGLDIGDQDELVGELRRALLAQDKTFLIIADRCPDDLRRHAKEGVVE